MLYILTKVTIIVTQFRGSIMPTAFFAHIGEIADLYKNKSSDLVCLDSKCPEMKDWYLAHQQIKIHEIKSCLFVSTFSNHIVIRLTTTQIGFQTIDAVLIKFLSNFNDAEDIDFRFRLLTDIDIFDDITIPVWSLSFIDENDNLSKFNDAWKSVVKDQLPPYHPLLKDSHHG